MILSCAPLNGLSEITLPSLSLNEIGENIEQGFAGFFAKVKSEKTQKAAKSEKPLSGGLFDIKAGAADTVYTDSATGLKFTSGSGATVTGYDATLFEDYCTLNGGNFIIPKNVEDTDGNILQVRVINALAFKGCTLFTSVTIGEDVTTVGASAFLNCTALEKVYFNALSCSFYSENADDNRRPSFYGCSSLTEFSFGVGVLNVPAYICRSVTALKKVTFTEEISSIGTRAFSDCTSLEEIDLNGVETIGSLAFYNCQKLQNPSFATVRSIGANAFQSCSALTEVEFSDSVTSIGDYAFANTPITQVTITKYINYLGKSAFGSCASLSKVIFNSPECSLSSDASVTTFYNDPLLTTFEFDSGVSSIPSYVCRNITNLTNINFNGKVTSVGAYAFTGCKKLLTTIDFTDVQSIGTYAFYGCEAFKEANFSSALSSIGSYAFYNTGFTELTIPEKVKSLGERAFASCASLSTVNFNATNCSVSSANPVFGSCSFLRTFNFGENVTTVPSYVCYGVTNLLNVNFAGTVDIIGTGAFQNCSGNLKEINLDNVTAVNAYAFSSCSKLDKVVLPKVKTISNNAFAYCSALSSVTLGDSLETIGSMAFYSAPFRNVTIPENVKSIGGSAFGNCTLLDTVYYNATSCSHTSAYNTSSGKEAERPTFYGDSRLTEIVFGETVSAVPSYMCRSLSNLITAEFLGTVITINTYAFEGCTKLKNVDLSNVRNIYNNAFYNCQTIDTLNFSEELRTVGNYAFYNLRIAEVTIPKNVTSLGQRAFTDCAYLETVYYNATNCTPSVYALNSSGGYQSYPSFFQNSTLKEFIFGETTTKIPDYICCLMSELEEVTFKGTVTSIGAYAFFNCSKYLESVDLSNVTSISYNAFQNCKVLTDINIPKVETIGSSAFNGCTDITEVEFSNKTTTISSYAFYNTNISELTIPENVKTIQDYAFSACSQLKKVNFNATSCSFGSNGAFTSDPLLTEFNFGEKISVIPAYVCRGISDIKTVTFGSNITKVGDYAFYNCTNYFKGIDLSKASSIGAYAFYNCSAMTEVQFENNSSLSSIGILAFYNSGITSLTIPANVKSIAGSAFGYCQLLEEVTVNATGCSYCGDYYNDTGNNLEKNPVFWRCNALKTVTFASNITDIPANIFRSVTNLTKIDFKATVKSIGNYAFGGCNSIQEIYYAGDLTDWTPLTSKMNTGNDRLKNAVQKANYTEGDNVAVVYLTDKAYNLTYYLKTDPSQADSAATAIYSYSLLSGQPTIKQPFPEEGEIIGGQTAKNPKYFNGWYVMGATEVTPAEIPDIMPTSDLKYYGYYSKEYKLTYQVLGDEGYIDYYTETLFEGEEITALPSPMDADDFAEKFPSKVKGYYFTGWSSVPATMPGNDVTVKGEFKLLQLEKKDGDVIVNCEYGQLRSSDDEKVTIKATAIGASNSEFISFKKENLTGSYSGLNVLALYNIEPYDGNGNLLTNGTKGNVTIKIKLPEKYNSGEDLTVFYKKIGSSDYANLFSVNVKVIDGYAVISYSVFGYFAICQKNIEEETTKKPDVTTPEKTTQAPYTGTVKIKNASTIASTVLNYKSKVTVYAVADTNGSNIHWFADGKDTGKTGASYTIDSAKAGVTLQAKVYVEGKVCAESEAVKVQVNTGFFARLAAFFRGIFGGHTKYDFG